MTEWYTVTRVSCERQDMWLDDVGTSFATQADMPINTITPSQTLEERHEIRRYLAEQIADLQQRLDFETQAIKDQMTAEGIDTYTIGDEVLVLSARNGKSSLDKTLLVELGVSTDVIAKATKTGKPYVQLDVRARKEGQ